MHRLERSPLGLSSAWMQVALLTFVMGFGILGYLAYRIYAEHPPVPSITTTTSGATLFTREDVFRGQMLFGEYGLMEFGTLFGHGAYLGPDFTADAIERSRISMQHYYARQGVVDVDAHVAGDF